MSGIMLGALLGLRNFRRLVIEMTEEHIAVGFGVFRRTISWDRIVDIRRDERPLLSYGGVGWRLDWRRRVGGWIVAFVDFRHPKVNLELRGGRYGSSFSPPATLRRCVA